MRTIDGLTKEEINSLTEEGINELIDRECMEKGIPLLPELPEQPQEPKIETDKEVYEIMDNFVVENMHHAKELVNLLKEYNVKEVKEDWESEAAKLKELPNYKKPEFKIREVASDEEYERHKKAYENYKEEKEDWEKIKARRDEIKKERQEVVEKVYDRVKEVRKEFREKGRIKHSFRIYLKLSDGNNEEALKYFQAGMDKDIENYEGLKEELLNMELGDE